MIRFTLSGWPLLGKHQTDLTAPKPPPPRRIRLEDIGHDLVSGEGFYVPRINEAELRDLFKHFRGFLLATIKSSSMNSSAIFADGAYPDRCWNIFLQLGNRSGNGALIADISRLNDRLHPFRHYDPQLFEDADAELEDIKAAANDDPKGAKLRGLIKRYHSRRIAKAAEYIRLMTSDLD